MKYLLTFIPLKHFFFGNERTFREDYVAVSEYFPQPTQLLGTLRLTLAEQHGLLKQYKNGRYSKQPEALKALTGTAKAHTFAENSDLGRIAGLSPMFIVNRSLDNAYFPTPFDVDVQIQRAQTSIMDDDGRIVTVDYPQKVSLSYLSLAKIGEYTYLKGYDMKRHTPQMLGNASFWNAYMQGETRAINAVLPFEYDAQSGRGVFVAHTQVGIGLDGKQTVEGKFYGKTDYTLAKGFAFAAVIDFDGKIEDAYVQIGAEASMFKMEVRPLEETPLREHPVVSRIFTPQREGGKLVAISDMMLQTTQQPVDFALVPYFRSVASIKSEKGKYVGTHRVRRTAPSGSVFYLSADALPSCVEGAYAKMGYNRYIRL